MRTSKRSQASRDEAGNSRVQIPRPSLKRFYGHGIPGVDLEALRREAQAAAEQFWARVPEWDPLQRTAEEACPWSFPLAERED